MRESKIVHQSVMWPMSPVTEHFVTLIVCEGAGGSQFMEIPVKNIFNIGQIFSNLKTHQGWNKVFILLPFSSKGLPSGHGKPQTEDGATEHGQVDQVGS